MCSPVSRPACVRPSRTRSDRLENYALTRARARRGLGQALAQPTPDGYGLVLDADAPGTPWTLSTPCGSASSAPSWTCRAGSSTPRRLGTACAALICFLEAEDTAGRMEARAQAHEAAGRLQLADEYRQLWEILVGAMEQTVWVCGAAPMTAARVCRTLPLGALGVRRRRHPGLARPRDLRRD